MFDVRVESTVRPFLFQGIGLRLEPTLDASMIYDLNHNNFTGINQNLIFNTFLCSLIGHKLNINSIKISDDTNDSHVIEHKSEASSILYYISLSIFYGLVI